MGRQIGSIRERRPGVWQIRVRVGTDPATGKERRVSKTVAGTRRQAERAMAELVVAVAKTPDDFALATTATLEELLERYLAHLASLGRSPSTIQHYRGNARRLIAQLGNPTIRELCDHPERIDRWRERLTAEGKAPNTVHQHYVLLSGAFKQAERWRWITSNPMKSTTPVSVRQKRARPPRTPQVQGIISTAQQIDPHYFMAIHLAAALGVRRGELVALQWRDIEGRNIRICRSIVAVDGQLISRDRTKSDKERLLHLDPDTYDHLMSWREDMIKRAADNDVTLADDAYILSFHPSGKPAIHPDAMTHAFRRIANRCGMPVARLHDLRHWHASMLIDNGESIVAVAARLGHDPATSMKTYGHLLREDERAASIIGRELARRPDQTLD